MRSWTSFVVFFLVLLLVIGGVHYYLYARLLKATEIEALQRWGRWVLTISAIGLPLGMVFSRTLPRSISSYLALINFSWMGLIVVTFFVTLMVELLRLGHTVLMATSVLPDDPSRRTFFAQIMSGSIGALSLVIGGWGAYSVAKPVAVKPVSVRLKRLPASMSGFKVVQLTDLHIGPTIDGKWLSEVVRQVNELNPDIVAITGDLVDGSVNELGSHVAPLADLKAKYGVYFVTGNHEYYSGVDSWIAELTRLGVRVLRNERVSIGDSDASFDLAGVDDYRASGFGGGHGADLEKALAGRDESRELILLAHQPKQALAASKKGVGLQLSGHTHGGQIYPWSFIVRLDQHFVAGLDRLGDMQIYTSCGTGYWGPPMRIGAPSEITLLELQTG